MRTEQILCNCAAELASRRLRRRRRGRIPAMPTVGHEPPGRSRPWLPILSYTSINFAPAPTTAVFARVSTVTRDMALTSITNPAALEYPP